MKTFAGTEKNYSRQYAAAYIVYMMAGSCFSRCEAIRGVCNWYLHYAEMPGQKQYDWETQVIRTTERLDRSFLKKISALRCEVSVRRIDNDICIEFRTGGFEELHCLVHADGTFQICPVDA